MAKGNILDEFGKPLQVNGKRKELADALLKSQQNRKIQATYDAARTSDEFKNYWANADAFDADSANSPAVRAPLVQRSRYEIANNGYAAGIASTYANDLVGVGPKLRMQTSSEGFNQMIEDQWNEWAREINFNRKLWTQAHAKHTDGESLAVIRPNKGIRHPVKRDVVLYETEQCATPLLPFGEKNYIDGIKFDDFGNPEWYDILKEHPGSNMNARFSIEAEQVRARFVLHWFRLLRPGQHRGVPESASTLNLGAASRRWREAVLSSAENIADISLFLKTQFEPNEVAEVDPMSTMDIQKRMMVALPAGHEAFQPKAEQPTANHADFHKTLINEQARPKSMPFNKAACDSSSYNFASGRLDHSTYYGSLDVEREDCNTLVLDRVFDVWFELAIVVYGWLGGNPDAVSPRAKAHVWDWPKHQVADIKSEAAANEVRLRSGAVELPMLWSESSQDYEGGLITSATAHGVSVDDMRKINLLRNLPQHVIPYVAGILGIEGVQAEQPSNEADEDETEDT